MTNKSLLNNLFKSGKQKHINQELERAHRKAEHVVESAVEKSEHIIEQTKFLDAHLKKELEEELRKTIVEVSGLIKQETQSAIAQILKEFSQELAVRLKKSQQELSKKTADLFQDANKEIAEYKQAKKDTIDAQIEQYAVRIAQDVLHKTLTAKEHKKIVFEALEQVKRDGLFERRG